jgi:dolichyl-phosphate beta-glucosyltransferase
MRVKMNNSIALIVPCFNEEIRFDKDRWLSLLSENQNTHWYFVDDGSEDSTNEILKEFTSMNLQNVQLVELEKNHGKGNAIRTGILRALSKHPYNVVGYLDSDLPYSNLDISRIITKMINAHGIDLLICSRVNLSGRVINRKRYRHLLGRAIASMIGAFWPDAPYDTQAGFKLFNSSTSFIDVLKQPFQTRWFFDIELIIRLKERNSNLRIWEEPANYWEDVSGSKITNRQFLIILKELKLILNFLKKGR